MDCISKELQDLFNDLQMNAYNKDYHTYYYKDANQIIRKHFELHQKQIKLKPEDVAVMQVEGIISCIQHQLNIKRRKEREGFVKATYEYSLKILDVVKKEIKATLLTQDIAKQKEKINV